MIFLIVYFSIDFFSGMPKFFFIYILGYFLLVALLYIFCNENFLQIIF